MNFKILMYKLRLKQLYIRNSLYQVMKRGLDISIVLISLPIILPIFTIIGFLIKLESKGPVFFIQRRVGKSGREFNFLKFRSMFINAEDLKKKLLKDNESSDGVTFKMRNDPRVTRIGRILRRTSLDELPQLLNVLKGDMSLVGPRPPVPNEVKQYNIRDLKRLDVIPGITCIWQVSGRSEIPFKKQVGLDKEYIVKRSLYLDLKLLILTVPAVLTGKGAY